MADSTQGPAGGIDASTLSQLMDGEWHEIDRSACVAGICSDATLRATWSRWHVVRDALKGEPVVVDVSLCDRIRAAIEEEEDYSNVVGIGATIAPPLQRHADALPAGANVRPLVPSRTSWHRGAMGFGLAASVAVATVFALQVWRGSPTGDLPGDALGDQLADGSVAPALGSGAIDGQVARAPARLPEVQLVGHSGSFWVSDSPGGTMQRSGSEEQLNLFLSKHLEQSPSAGREGLLPYSRLVGYDDRRVAGGR